MSGIDDLSEEEIVQALITISCESGIKNLTACVEGDSGVALVQFSVTLHPSLEEAQAAIQLKPDEDSSNGQPIH